MPELATKLVQDNLPGYPNAGAVPPGSRVEFTLSQPVFNASNGKDENMMVVAPIDPITGDMGHRDPLDATRFGARLFCNDDPNCKPQGTFWRVHYVIPGPGPARPDLAIVVSTGNTDPVNLATLAQPVGGTFSYGIRVKEVDGAPDISNVMTLIVSNGSLTDNGGQSATLVTGGGGGGGGSGTVTSVAQTVPAEFAVSGSPITTAGTLALTKTNQAANQVWAGPITAPAAAPAFRALVAADLPATYATAAALTTEANTRATDDNTLATAITAETNRASTAEAAKLTDPTNTKGDLIAHGTTTTRLPVGTDAQVLTADSTQALGVKWAAAGGGGASFPLQSPFPGGNARGAGATDLQTAHSANNMVASGTDATIGGGQDNIASGNWSVVAGGRTNTAAGRDAYIGGGIGNTTAGNEPTIVAGNGNTASNDNSFVGGGQANTASGINSTVGGGIANTASGRSSSVPGGDNTTAGGDYSRASGQYAAASLYGQDAFAAGRFSITGDAQRSDLVARAATTDATATELFLDGSAARLTLAANRASAYRILIIARQDTGAAVAGWEAVGVMNRITGGHIALSGNSVTALGTPPAGWAFAVTADTTNDALKLAFTGAAATNVHVVAKVSIVEVI